MYALESAVAMPKAIGEVWVEKDFSGINCIDIVRDYSEAYFVLTNVFVQGKQTLTLSTVTEQLATFVGTFNDWLVSLGNKTLPTTTGVPVVTEGKSSYRTAFHAGFSVTPFDHLKSPSEDLSRNEEIDLLLTRKDTDYEYMYRCVLATVNGLFHRTGVRSDGFVIYQGGVSANLSKGNMVGLLNFEHVSKFKILDIDPSWIKRPVKDLALSDRVYLKTPESMFGKTVYLVLAGFLIPLGDTLIKVADDVLALSTNRLSLINRYYLANELIDLSKLSLSKLENDPKRVLAEFHSDQFIEELLALPQSFLVVFDHANVSIERQALESLNVTGRWLSHEDPRGLLQVDFGYAPEYNVSAEPDGRYVLQSLPVYQRLLVTQTKKLAEAEGELVTDLFHGYDALKLPAGHLSVFKGQTVEIKA